MTVNCRANLRTLDFLGCKSWFQAASQHQDGPYFLLGYFLYFLIVNLIDNVIMCIKINFIIVLTLF